MILTGPEIVRMHGCGEITLDPFDPARVNPNSFDVSLGSTLLRYMPDVVDTRADNPYETLTIPGEGFVLRRGRFYLGYVAEVVGSDHVVPLLHAKLGIAKLGLFVHVTANVIDIGNHANFSLHLVPTGDIRVFAGMQIAQVSFWRTVGDVRLYTGKYKSARGLAPSQSYKHFQR